MSRGMQHVFSQTPTANIQRSSFDRSHCHKTTFQPGQIYPIFCDEVLPGDTFNLNTSVFARMATPLVPVMDNGYLDFFFFFVPNRLVWSNWQKFNGEQASPGDSTSFLVPVINSPSDGFPEFSIYDYMGLPTKGATAPYQLNGSIAVNALPFRAWNLIFNEWFRDQNIANPAPKNMGDGPDTYTDYNIYARYKRHDYFTSCLPWPQKGTAQTVPTGNLKTTWPVRGLAVEDHTFTHSSRTGMFESDGTSHTYTVHKTSANSNINPWGIEGQTIGGTDWPNVRVDLSTVALGTINELRQAFQIQRLYERDARGGTRYTEIIRSHFGVVSPDGRLQRPEYLGGGSVQINMHPIAQTSATGLSGGTTPAGNLSATATASGSRIGFTKSFTEHGYIIGIVSSRLDLTYMKGTNRMWMRQTRWDFFWPALAHIGEQAVLQAELRTRGSSATSPKDSDVFGYQERYAEYRYKPSIVTGLFQSGATGSLDFWHFAQDFSAPSGITESWLREPTVPWTRNSAVPTQHIFLMDLYFKLKCARPMPVYSIPGMVDHF